MMHTDDREKYISAQAADRLISAHDGDVALLWIYMQRTGCGDIEKAAGALCRTMREMSAAEEKLRRMGLIDSAPLTEAGSDPSPEHLPDSDELPEYSADDVVTRSREDGKFSAVVHEAQRIMGRALSSSDLKMLFGIYDYLALPAEVILELLNYCASVAGDGKRPSMRYIKKEAYVWANRELITLEQAEEYISVQHRRKSELAGIQELLNIKGRSLTGSEAKYIGTWLDMGFEADAIAIAYDRTVTNTGSLKWPYMDKIIHSWKEKGLLTVAQITEKDSRRVKPSGSQSSGKKEQVDMDELRRVLDKI